jgi:hypothetical protein
MQIRPVGAELFHAHIQTDGPTDKTQLIVAFRNYANAPKKRRKNKYIFTHSGCSSKSESHSSSGRRYSGSVFAGSRDIPNTPEYSRILPNIPEYSRILPNNPEFSRIRRIKWAVYGSACIASIRTKVILKSYSVVMNSTVDFYFSGNKLLKLIFYERNKKVKLSRYRPTVS